MNKYPEIYKKFKGKSSKREYWIQDLTENYFETIIDQFIFNFIEDEKVCNYAGVLDDPFGVQDVKDVWKKIMSQKLSVIALCCDSNGIVQIAGFNLVYLSYPNVTEFTPKGKAMGKIIKIGILSEGKCNIFDQFGIDRYLKSYTLFVDREFRGDAIGNQLLSVRDMLGKKLNCYITGAPFFSLISQQCAMNVGFKVLSEIFYKDLSEDDKIERIEKDTPSCQFMYKIIGKMPSHM